MTDASDAADPRQQPQIAAVLKRPFAEQVAFFRGKLGQLVPTATWRDMQREQHDRAFMVAGAARADLLADLAGAVDTAIVDGESIGQFRARFGEIVQRQGWQGWTGSDTEAGRAWRTRVIYTTNLRTSYAAGRLVQLQHFPLWVYRHSGAEHPRLQHLAWNGLTLPADDAFWRTHYPPNGWGCGCRVAGANSPAGAQRVGGIPGYGAPPPGWNVRDPSGNLPGVGDGWDYAPGASVTDAVRALAGKTVAWPYEIAKAFMVSVPDKARDALAIAIRRQPETAAAVRRYAQRAMGAQGAAPYQTMGLLTAAQADEVARITGGALGDELYDWTLDASTVRKVLKDHGDDAAEARSGQAGLSLQDFGRLPRIIDGADRIEYGGQSGVGRHVVRVIKRMGQLEYWAVFEVRSGRQMLALQSMWIRGRPPTLRP